MNWNFLKANVSGRKIVPNKSNSFKNRFSTLFFTAPCPVSNTRVIFHLEPFNFFSFFFVIFPLFRLYIWVAFFFSCGTKQAKNCCFRRGDWIREFFFFALRSFAFIYISFKFSRKVTVLLLWTIEFTLVCVLLF